MSKADMSREKCEVPHGSLDLLILQTLHRVGPLHGYAIARRIEQVGGTLPLSQGAIHPALIRLEQQGWIRTEWGVSETSRRVKIYALTKSGTQQLRLEVERWRKATALVARFLGAES